MGGRYIPAGGALIIAVITGILFARKAMNRLVVNIF
jgi:hypothetical protein